MKKHDEGYALVLVLVTLVVLSLLATSLMTVGLQNLRLQKRIGDRMVEKYAAQGKIEKVLAVLNEGATIEKKTGKEPKEQIEAWLLGIPELQDVTVELQLTVTEEDDTQETGSGETSGTGSEGGSGEETTPVTGLIHGKYDGIMTVTATEGTTKIQCRIAVSGKYEEKAPVGISYTNTYEIKPEKPLCASYDITRSAEGGEAP